MNANWRDYVWDNSLLDHCDEIAKRAGTDLMTPDEDVLDEIRSRAQHISKKTSDGETKELAEMIAILSAMLRSP